MEFDMFVEFDDNDIPADMDEWQYARHLADEAYEKKHVAVASASVT